MELGEPPLGSMLKCLLRQESSIEAKTCERRFYGVLGFYILSISLSLSLWPLFTAKNIGPSPGEIRQTPSPRRQNRHQQQQGEQAGMLGSTHHSCEFPARHMQPAAGDEETLAKLNLRDIPQNSWTVIFKKKKVNIIKEHKASSLSRFKDTEKT